MDMIPADKVISHIVGTVAEFRARCEAAKLPQVVEERPIVLSSAREVFGISKGPAMREALGLAA